MSEQNRNIMNEQNWNIMNEQNSTQFPIPKMKFAQK